MKVDEKAEEEDKTRGNCLFKINNPVWTTYIIAGQSRERELIRPQLTNKE
jgi:hypothetical protein